MHRLTSCRKHFLWIHSKITKHLKFISWNYSLKGQIRSFEWILFIISPYIKLHFVFLLNSFLTPKRFFLVKNLDTSSGPEIIDHFTNFPVFKATIRRIVWIVYNFSAFLICQRSAESPSYAPDLLLFIPGPRPLNVYEILCGVYSY